MTAFVGLLQRDFRVLRREIGPFMIRIIMQPLLFLFVFTYVFPHMNQGSGANPMASAGGINLGTVLLPGLMAVAIMFTGIAAVALPLSQEFGITREIDDRVMCPLPVAFVALEKVCFSAMQSILGALLGAGACRKLVAVRSGAGTGKPGCRGPRARHRSECETSADWPDLLDRRDPDHISRLRVLSLGLPQPHSLAADCCPLQPDCLHE